MKKLILLLLFIPLVSFGQQYILMADKSFESTELLEVGVSYDSHDLNICFAKDEKHKYIVVNVKPSLDDYRIAGKLKLLLNNGKVIILASMPHRDFVNDRARAMFTLSDKEFNNLKENNITEFRYSLRFMAFEMEDFSVENNIDIPKLISFL
tara:strand:+ start:148 stop:603 length:456 start_codon:yes stop_codon:yes gene_type:complete